MKFIKYNWVSILFGVVNIYMIYCLGSYNQMCFKILGEGNKENLEMIKTGYLCIEKDINQHTQKMGDLISRLCGVLAESEKDNQETANAALLILENLEIVNKNIKLVYEGGREDHKQVMNQGVIKLR